MNNFTKNFLGLSFEEIIILERISPQELFSYLQNHYSCYAPESHQQLLQKAFDFGMKVHKTQKRDTGVPYFTHPLIVALLMIEYQPDVDLLISVLLHDAIEDADNPEEASVYIKETFGDTVFYLIDGVSKVFSPELKKEKQAIVTLEKLFLLAEKDVRILIIKLFDRLHNAITILGKTDPSKREKKLKETIRIYIPLAERLGLWSVKKRLEDACTLGMSPNEFASIMRVIEEGKDIQNCLYETIQKTSLPETVEVQMKQFSASSMLKYLQANNYIQPEDTFFIRIIIPDTLDCYKFLQTFGADFPQKKNLFTDYITNQKENGYQALHSFHIFHNEYAIRVHVMTRSMQQKNDKGVFTQLQQGIVTLPLVKSETMKKYIDESDQFLTFLSQDILARKITIHGREFGAKEFPERSLLIDILVRLYPDIFQNFIAATRNGKPITLSEMLEDNDIVTFAFSTNPQISLYWKRHTSSPFTLYAINKYFENQPVEKKEKEGKKLLESLLLEVHKEHAVGIVSRHEHLKEIFSVSSDEDLFVLLYEGKIQAYEILEVIESHKSSWIEKITSLFSSSEIFARLVFYSSQKKISDCVDYITDLATESKVQVLSVSTSYKADRPTNQGEILLRAEKATRIFQLLETLQLSPYLIFHMVPSWRLWMKVAFGVVFPFIISGITFAFLFSSQAKEYALWLYTAVFAIIFANVMAYRFTTRYFSFIRYKQIVLTLLVFINLLLTGVFLFLFFQKGLDILNLNFFLPMMALLFSILLPVLMTNKTSLLVSQTLTLEEYKQKQKDKIWGYFLRFLAVIVWGLEPIFFKYTSLGVVSSEIRIFVCSLGIFFVSLLFLLFHRLFFIQKENKKIFSYSLPINKFLIAIVVGTFLMSYFMNQSLNFTSGTTFMILNNFAPIFALIVAFLFWRSDISYLKERKHVLWVFTVFFIGGIGSAFLFYNDFLQSGSITPKGSIYAFLSMVMDALVVIAQIRYAKIISSYQGALLTGGVFMIIAISLFPFLIPFLHLITFDVFITGLLVGALSGFGYIINYEAFRRMDGFIAYLMLNFAIFITFIVEVFFLGKLYPTWLIIFGGVLIIGSAIIAEFINTHCEKKQIKS